MSRTHAPARWIAAAVAAVVAVGGVVAPLAAAATPSMTFFSSGSFTVPAGTEYMKVTAVGGRGGRLGSSSLGGRGGHVVAYLPVSEMESFRAEVGSHGGDGGPASTSGRGGANGGGDAGVEPGQGYIGGGGGGATDLRRGGIELGDRVVVAAGGGGNGIIYDGADAGKSALSSGCAGFAGAGTLGSGGQAGPACGSMTGTPGGLGFGGGGGARRDGGNSGGGGGAGYYGGGGGGPWSGGGGGSSFVAGAAFRSTIALAPREVAPSLTVEFFGAPTVTVTLDVPTIEADGVSTTDVTISAAADGAKQPWHQVELVSTDPDHSLSSVVIEADGTFSATLTASRSVGSATIRATLDTGETGSAVLTQGPMTPYSVALDLDPVSVVADGTTEGVATVRLLDRDGEPMPGETVAIDAAGHTLTEVTDLGDGTYTAGFRATTTAGSFTFTASVASNDRTATATLDQSPGALHDVAVTFDADTVVANGTSVTTAVATLTDEHGNPISVGTVSFTSDGDQSIGAVTNLGEGRYRAVITSSLLAGDVVITAKGAAHGVTRAGTAALSQVAGPLAVVDLDVPPGPLVADGVSTKTITVVAADAHGNPIRGAYVAGFSPDGQTFGAAVEHPGGIYSVSVVASTVAGSSPAVIAVADGPAIASSSFDIEQVAGPPVGIDLVLSHNELTADGFSRTTATVALADAFENPVLGTDVIVTSDGGQSLDDVVDHGDGTYSVEVTATTLASTSIVTATVSGSPVSASTALTQHPGAPARLTLRVEPWDVLGPEGGWLVPLAAEAGPVSFRALATVQDEFENPVPGVAVHFATDGAQSVGDVLETVPGEYLSRIEARPGEDFTVTASLGTLTALHGVEVPAVDDGPGDDDGAGEEAPDTEAPDDDERGDDEAPDDEARDDDGSGDDDGLGDDDGSGDGDDTATDDELPATGSGVGGSPALVFLTFLVLAGFVLRFASRSLRSVA